MNSMISIMILKTTIISGLNVCEKMTEGIKQASSIRGRANVIKKNCQCLMRRKKFIRWYLWVEDQIYGNCVQKRTSYHNRSAAV
ncbi:hypothetical protein D3C87_1922610 [compost metagenome]